MNVQAAQAIPCSSSSFSSGRAEGVRSKLGDVDSGKDWDIIGAGVGIFDFPAIATADVFERGTPHNWHINFGARFVSAFLLPQISHSQRMNDVSPVLVAASPAPGLTSAGFEGCTDEERDKVIFGDDVRKPA
jgi:hypothetical protein